MPSALQKPRMYGTARRGGGTAKASFRGSVRAWDNQRKGGLLMQSAAPQQPQSKPTVQQNHSGYDSDSDGSDDFELESPPESPVTTKTLPTESSVPLPPCTPARQENLKDSEDSSADESEMPALRNRKPLAQKSVSETNRLLQAPNPNKAKGKGRNRKSKSRKSTVKESVIIEAIRQPTTPLTAKRVTRSQDEEISTPDHMEVELPLSLNTDSSVEEAAPAVVDLASDEEDSAVTDLTTDEASTQSDSSEDARGKGEVESEVEKEELGDTALLSPQKRAALHNQARRRGRGRGAPLAFKRDSLASNFQSLAIESPLKQQQPELETESEESAESSPRISTRTPSPSRSPTPESDPVLTLAPESEVFNLLPFCDEKRIMTYTEYLKSISPDFSRIKKIGESSFAEVYIHKTDDGRSVVLKLVPLAEENNVKEVIQELKITRTLSPLPNFINYLGCQVVAGDVPEGFEEAWRIWAETKDEEYQEGISKFGEADYYAIIALEDGGCSLEHTVWKTWDVPLEIFRQTVVAFAEAERQREFEHRDLHNGNLLVRDLKKEREDNAKEESGVGRELEVGSFEDVAVTVIDYTLSRAQIPEEFGGGIAYMELEEGMFEVEGLYQFDIYRSVREEVVMLKARSNGTKGRRCSGRVNKPEWSTYCPRSNVMWLHYLIKILIRSDEGRRNGGKLWIRKPTKAKKNAFDLDCWGKMMKLHEMMDKEADEECNFNGAVDIEKWCSQEGLFEGLEEERKKRGRERGEKEEEPEAVEEDAAPKKTRRKGRGKVRK
ncbi:hypothetical protein H072_5118 [Dactylellina haptotyla CBS 200.50]|uniref:non-specific serine/threonine protein kinase n=1 Tax=Dactylellina haptotyla (strain CBS 200.50) TaxID=1284197 RepID=S8BNE8_DACHA|nr:hypothetical protein H072_5118 [Dactylellina haptotyla CBS 200.50]